MDKKLWWINEKGDIRSVEFDKKSQFNAGDSIRFLDGYSGGDLSYRIGRFGESLFHDKDLAIKSGIKHRIKRIRCDMEIIESLVESLGIETNEK